MKLRDSAGEMRVSALACLVTAVVALAGPPVTEAASPIQFTTPRQLSTVLGPSTAELQVQVSPDRIERIEIHVDGQLIATLHESPWTVDWDAGDGSRGHRLSATMYLTDGEEFRAAVQTSRLRINQVEEVGLVNLYPIVRSGGAYLSELTKADFRVFERGVEQKIRRFSTEPKPLRIAIALDTSRSMDTGKGQNRRIERAREAALDFLDVLTDGDEAMLVTFDDEVQIVQEITGDRNQLAEGIQSTALGRGTALYDAIWRASTRLQRFDGRRVLVLLSDGKDEAYSGLEPGSLHTLDEALDQALRSDVMVFVVGLGKQLDQLDFERRYVVADILQRIADATGGRALFAPRAGQLRRSFRTIAADLRNQYSLAYVPKDATRNGEWREIEVTVPGRNAKVVCRKGYFASPPKGTTASTIR